MEIEEEITFKESKTKFNKSQVLSTKMVKDESVDESDELIFK